MMNCARRRQNARIQRESAHLEHTEVRIRVLAYKWLQCLAGRAFGAPDGDMRMEGAQVRFESCMQGRVLDAPVKNKKVGMPFTYTCPDYGGLSTHVENPDAAYRQKEWRHSYLC